MKPQEAYEALVKRSTVLLRAHGFSRKGRTLFHRQDANWALINLQRSRRNTVDLVKFTVNLGVLSTRLAAFFADTPPGKRPSVWDCHWRQRIGWLLPQNRDVWWSIDIGTSFPELSSEIEMYLVDLVVPELEAHISDEALRDLWLSGRSPGLTDFQRLMNLSVLLKEIGPVDALSSVLKDLGSVSEGRPCEPMAEMHIEKLAQLSGE
jgi:hypothetical protein